MTRTRRPLVLLLILAACTATYPSPATGPSSNPEAPGTAPTTAPSTVPPTAPPSTPPEDTFAGVSGLTRVTAAVEQLAAAYGLFDPITGEYFGPVDPDGQILWFEPITGYADFSDYTIEDRWNLDIAVVNDLIFQCLSDLDPRFADLIATTGDFNWSAFGGQLEQVAFAAYIACDLGLRLPRLTQAEWTDAMWEEAYAYHQAWIDCVEREADIDWGPRIDYDTWRSQGASYDFPPGHPYTTLDTATLQHLNTACPDSPPGGYGAWDPGDPVGTP